MGGLVTDSTSQREGRTIMTAEQPYIQLSCERRVPARAPALFQGP